MIESCSKSNIINLECIQKRAVKTIDRNQHKNVRYDDLMLVYGLNDLVVRRKRHNLSVMYRHSGIELNLDMFRPEFELRKRDMLKCKLTTTQLTKQPILQRC